MKFCIRTGYKKLKSHAFTLAEVLITLAIVGVVAVLVIPSVTTSVQTRVRARQVEVSKVKFNKAAQLMALNNEIGPYYTDGVDFVQNLGRYLKINQICRVGSSPTDLPSISSCFDEKYTNVKTADGEEIEITNLGNGGRAFGVTAADSSNSWTTPSVAFYTIDGTRYIIAYNTKCPEVAAGVYEGNAAAGCIAGLVDVDGAKKPNTLGKDVYLIGSAKSLGENSCVGNRFGYCYSQPVRVADLIASKGHVTQAECEANRASWGLPADFCTDTISYYADYNWYASVVRECGGWAKVANPAHISQMVNYIYDIDSYTFSKNVTDLTFDDAAAARAAEFGLPDFRDNYVGVITWSLSHSHTGGDNSPLAYYVFQDSLLTNRTSSGVITGASDGVGSNAFFFCNLK